MQFKGNGECETSIGWRSKRLWRCQLFRWGKGDSVTETGPPANNAMPNRGLSSMGKWYCGTQRSDPPSCFPPRHGLRVKSSTWQSPLGRSVCCHWLLLCENCPHGPKLRTSCKSSALLQVLPALLFAADLSHVILQDLPHQWVSACMQVAGLQDSHMPHPHIRLLSLPPSSTYIIAFFHLPHPAGCSFCQAFRDQDLGPNPGRRP
jgi:hypothetical protein